MHHWRASSRSRASDAMHRHATDASDSRVRWPCLGLVEREQGRGEALWTLVNMQEALGRGAASVNHLSSESCSRSEPHTPSDLSLPHSSDVGNGVRNMTHRGGGSDCITRRRVRVDVPRTRAGVLHESEEAGSSLTAPHRIRSYEIRV